jgi:hypothetical protein
LPVPPMRTQLPISDRAQCIHHLPFGIWHFYG